MRIRLVALAVFVPVLAFSQQVGQIVGIITDPSGAIIPGVFGQVPGAQDPRIIQFGLKMVF